jgi:hypothetical protein
MRYLMSSLVIAAALAAPQTARAEEALTVPPVDRVVLSTAGLAHIEHRLTVEGDRDLRLPLRLNQIDDVMKSLMLFDATGRIGGVTLPGRQPLAEAFRDLPFDRGELNDPVLLLNAYQGAAVTVAAGGETHAGQLVQVTAEPRIDADGMQETRYRLTLMTAEGLRRLWLDSAQSLRFDEARVRDEILKALAAVRAGATADTRDVTLALKGEGRRDVRLGYVIDAPLWKASYRLVMPAEKGEGMLQGWAIVENMTANDWKDVDLTLVSGNPVTFRQQLYQSYYVSRPEVPVEVLGRVMPRVDDGAFGSAAAVEERAAASGGARALRAKAVAPQMAPAPAMMAESMAFDAAAGNIAGAAPDVLATAQNAAVSEAAATQVLFRFPDRLSLPAGQSLMIPFLSENMEMERVALYQPDTHARHPLAAVAVTNAQESGLPPGVLTLFEKAGNGATSFVGDARLPMLAAGETRYLSYALDNKMTVDRRQESDSRRGRATLAEGVLRLEQTLREKTGYTVKAPKDGARALVIEHPRRPDFTLVSPKPEEVEVTPAHYRLRLDLKAGEEKRVDVVLERILSETVALADLPYDQLLVYAGAEGGLEDDAREAFAELAAKRRAIDAIDAQLAQLEQERATIFADQQRLRENIRSVSAASATSDLHKRYLATLDEQETRLADIAKAREALNAKRAAAEADFKKAVAAAGD